MWNDELERDWKRKFLKLERQFSVGPDRPVKEDHFDLKSSTWPNRSIYVWTEIPTGRAQETVKCWKKGNSIPMQNTHDLLVGTLSIGISSLYTNSLQKHGKTNKYVSLNN